jgi:uroporphyrinogen decarboxylase
MGKTMTRRERVLAAVSHKQPDRVPIDLGGTRDSSLVVEAYEKVKKYFGVEDNNPLCDRMMRVVHVDEQILKKLDIDTRAVFPGGPLKGLGQEMGPRKYRDAWGVVRVHPEGSYYYDQTEFPLSGEISVSDIVKYPWPDPDDPGLVRGLKERLAWIRENTDCAAILTLPAPFVHISQYLRGFEDWFCDIMLNPKRLEALFDAILEITLRIAKRQLAEVGREVDIIICADDLGAQTGLQMNYEKYGQLIKPRHEKFFRQVHEMTPAKLLLHTCGSVARIIDDLIEIGVDILNPVQPSAAGMNPFELKKKYGPRLAFWGGPDAQKTLPFGSVADIKKMVEDLAERMGAGGGFVLSSCHNIQPDVPLENILTMFRHAREYVPSYAK